jgi:ABC-type uncharacterized transport system permease subunit
VPKLFAGYRVNVGVVIALVTVVAFWVLLFRTYLGFQLQVGGLAPAAAQARNGQFAEAVASAQSAQKLAQAAGQTQLANDIESRIMLYQKNQPYLVAPKTD